MKPMIAKTPESWNKEGHLLEMTLDAEWKNIPKHKRTIEPQAEFHKES